MNIHERYGRLSDVLEEEKNAHLATLALLKSILDGEIALERVKVSDDNRWTVTPPPPLKAVK
ncbi:hypothetical protein LCGC14_2851710 [marine sediment metagenome]|uniref:Uncharacterized protein n=1 Tax=marine sediment metagenome TaxID=412755 RepID=A0A0F8YV03_9ZZZZ